MNKKPNLSFHEVKTKIILGDETFSVIFDALHCFVSNDGIGGYEFHGQKGFDAGHDYVEEFDFSDVRFFSEENNQVGDPELCSMLMKELESGDEAFEAVNAMFDAMDAEQGLI